jgi:hypothetical protein
MPVMKNKADIHTAGLQCVGEDEISAMPGMFVPAAD